MGKIHFLIGGARSGKSAYGEKFAASLSKKVGYIATAEIIDDEMAKRIEFHKKRRPKNWVTFEIGRGEIKTKKFVDIINKAISIKLDVLLIDCITILVFRLLYRFGLDDIEVMDNSLEKRIENEVGRFFKKFLDVIRAAATEKNLDIIIISNEVGLGIVPPTPFGRIFRDMLGNANREIARISGEVLFFVAGLNIKMK